MKEISSKKIFNSKEFSMILKNMKVTSTRTPYSTCGIINIILTDTVTFLDVKIEIQLYRHVV